jgi:ubiquinone/menaquinone biosynthesis C-methylase UbiE
MKLNWAERWVVNNPLRVTQQWIQMHLLKRMTTLEKGCITLEIGCGRGAGARLILNEFQPAHLHIMDLDGLMIQKAREYLSQNEKDRISFYVANATYLPFRSGTLDAVFGFAFLHHVHDWRSALSEIVRVLKTGGIFFMEELYPSVYKNFITKRILLHPTGDRFVSQDLRKYLEQVRMPIRDAIEVKKLGIIGVAIKGV